VHVHVVRRFYSSRSTSGVGELLLPTALRFEQLTSGHQSNLAEAVSNATLSGEWIGKLFYIIYNGQNFPHSPPFQRMENRDQSNVLWVPKSFQLNYDGDPFLHGAATWQTDTHNRPGQTVYSPLWCLGLLSHPSSGVGKWGLTSAGKAKADMVHSVRG